MMYEHPQTGLRVAVTETTEHAVVRDCIGNVTKVPMQKELETECGQNVFHEGGDDSVATVMTSRGEIRLIRC